MCSQVAYRPLVGTAALVWEYSIGARTAGQWHCVITAFYRFWSWSFPAAHCCLSQPFALLVTAYVVLHSLSPSLSLSLSLSVSLCLCVSLSCSPCRKYSVGSAHSSLLLMFGEAKCGWTHTDPANCTFAKVSIFLQHREWKSVPGAVSLT